MRLQLILIAIFLVLALAYIGLGLYLLVEEADTVEACTVERGIIWKTTLWHYCLASVFGFPLSLLCLLRLPFQKAADAIELHVSRWQLEGEPLRSSRIDQETMKWGFTMQHPDWMFMAMGVANLMVGLVCSILAFWGYCQLFLMKTQCTDLVTAFRELWLWRFGLATFIMQVVAASLATLFGAVGLAAPACFELTLPPWNRQPRLAVGSPAASYGGNHHPSPRTSRDMPPPLSTPRPMGGGMA